VRTASCSQAGTPTVLLISRPISSAKITYSSPSELTHALPAKSCAAQLMA